MITAIAYKMSPCSQQLTAGRWKPRIGISWEKDGISHYQLLEAPEGYTSGTKEAADNFALEMLAKRWIDGQRS